MPLEERGHWLEAFWATVDTNEDSAMNFETLRSLFNNKPVSDRRVLNAAWTIVMCMQAPSAEDV